MSPRADKQTWGAIERLVREADIEVIPLKGADEKLSVVPTSTLVTITCSVKLGLERTLEHTEKAVKAGYRVIPHLAARQVPDEAYLREFVGRIGDMGIKDLYVIGGDAPEPAGPYDAALQILEALAGFEHPIESIGVGCYPEGHPSVSDEALFEALKAKQPYAKYMASQLCFDPKAMVSWLTKMRAAGITLPLHVGLAAPMQARKLIELSMKIGVGTSVRYLTKQHGFIGNLLRGSSYKPEDLLIGMGDALTAPGMGIEALHLFSFNQIAPTVEWQQRIAGAGQAAGA